MAMAKVVSNAGLGIFHPTKVGIFHPTKVGFTGHGFPPRSLKFNLNHARHSRLFNQFHGHTSLLARPQLKGFGKLCGLSAMGEMEVAQHNQSLAQQVELDVGMVVPATECHVEKAVKALRDGKVIAVPTDTLYGLACDACSPAAVQRIYEIKGRSMTSPLAVCISDVMDFDRFAITSHLPDGLLQSLLPGPVTVVLNRGQESLLEKSLNPGIDTIGIRIPECDFIRMVAHDFGSAIVLTSANQSGQPSTVCIEEFKQLWQHCAYIFDGGQLPVGRAGSTIIDLTRPNLYRVLRPGSASKETIEILDRFGFEEVS